MTRIVLLVDDVAVQARIRDALGDDRFRRYVSLGHVESGAAPEITAKSVAASGADVVLLGPAMDTEEALRLASAFDEDHPEIAVILVAAATPALWEQALRSGVSDVVSPDARPAAYRRVLDHALHVADVRRSNIIHLRDADGGAGAGRIITVVSPKGGAGKTMTATNIAVGIARQAPDDVVIVDLDLQFGDVASSLQLVPDLSLADLAPGETAHDPAKVKLLLAHHPQQLFALCAPDDPAAADDVSANDIGPLLRTLAAEFRFVVVDTCAGIDAVSLAAIDVSTDLVLVGAMDVPSTRSLRKLIDTLDHLDMTSARRIVVLNRSDSHVDLVPGDVASAIGLPISVSIPSSRSIPLSINHGCPVLVFDPRSPAVRPLEELVSLVGGGAPTTGLGSRSLFRRSPR